MAYPVGRATLMHVQQVRVHPFAALMAPALVRASAEVCPPGPMQPIDLRDSC